MKDFIQCRTCAKKPGPKNMPGFFYVDLENGQQAIAECSCHKRFVKEELNRIKASKAGLWYSDYTPANDYVGTKSLQNVEHLEEYIRFFKSPAYSSSIIYMHGPNGSQKTTLAQWVGLSLLRKGFKVKYILMQYLVSKLANENFETDEEAIKELEDLKNVDCLIIDEALDKNKVTLYKSGYQLPFLESFIRDRVDYRKKGIVFVSNVAPSDIESQGFGKSIQDFIVRNTVPKETDLLFKDVYHQVKSSFDVDKLFKGNK